MLNSHDAKTLDAIEVAEADPLLSGVDLPLRAMYFPLGFPLEVISNSPAVMAAAEQSWGRFQARFAYPPLVLQLGVSGRFDNVFGTPLAPVYRLHWNLLSNVADAHNFTMSDLAEGRSFGWITENTAECPLYFRYYMLEAAAMAMVASLRAAPLHVACVTLAGSGVLLCGDSGAGKSSLAYACVRAGWTFTADDSAYIPLDRNDRLVVGNSHKIRFRSSGIEIFPELEGWPVTPRAAGKPSIEVATAELPGFRTADCSVIDYIVFLNRQSTDSPRLVPCSRESLLPWFRQSLYTASESYVEQEVALERLFEAETFELRYRKLDWAVKRLEALVLTGR